ncbi:MAG: hypothetical protein L6V95_14535 [Candidatus Melainabacteria bacterium]|nr:MAG: hypothetical protein L6V95_14535 [Candidatus Melainabacteria bacterium]
MKNKKKDKWKQFGLDVLKGVTIGAALIGGTALVASCTKKQDVKWHNLLLIIMVYQIQQVVLMVFKNLYNKEKLVINLVKNT